MMIQTTLLFNPLTAKQIGLNESIVLQQLYYWQRKYSSFERWIYNSYEDWQKQFSFWSPRTIQRTFLSLEKRGFITSKRSKTCKFYKLCIDKVKKFFPAENMPACPVARANLAGSIYKDTKITHKNNSLYQKEYLNVLRGKHKFHLEKERVKELFDIWEKNISSHGKQLSITEKRIEKLQKVFDLQFNSSVSNWIEFVNNISKSDFLMGKVTNFKVSFDWAIQEENALKIIEGNYSNKKEEKTYDPNIKSESQKSIDAIDQDTSMDSRWKEFLKKSIDRLGNGVYVSWFSKIKFISEGEGNLKLYTRSMFEKNWIENNYKKHLLEIGRECFGINNVRFT